MRKTVLGNKKFKNAGAIVALAFLCVIGAACGQEKTEPSLIPSDTPAASTSETPQNTAEPSKEPTAIPTDTPKPTNTPTPISAEAQALYNQHEKKLTSAEYIKMQETFAGDTYGFPVISITTKDSASVYLEAETVPCVIYTLNCPESFALTTTAQIRVRGNSSAAPKSGSGSDTNRAKYPNESYPYKIKFDEKQNLFGLNSGNAFKDWVLLETSTGRPFDNIYAFSLANALHGGKYYVSDACMVHVFLNGTYMGMYTLCEQSEAKKNRVNVNEPKENYTGTDIGYFLEIDNYANSKVKPCFKLTHHDKATVTDVLGQTKTFKSRYITIRTDVTSDEQTKFIQNYTNNVFNIIYEAVENKKYYMFNDKWELVEAKGVYDNAKDCIGAVLDLDSAVCSYLIEEITLDYDRGEGSFFMAVDFSEKSKFKKLTFLCPWDFEWGYFGASSFPGKKYDLMAGAFDNLFDGKYGDRANYWFVLLMKEKWFRDMVREKWAAFYDGGAYDTMVSDMKAIAAAGKADRDYANTKAKENKDQKITSLGDYTNLITVNDKRIKWLNDNWFGSGVTR